MPDLTLPGTDGPRRLRPLQSDRLLVIFYQEDATPTCSTQVVSFREDFDAVREAGAEIVAISSDSQESHAAFIERLGGLPFPLLSDTDGSAARAFGVWDTSIQRAFRSVFVIDRKGRIKHAVRHYSPANLTEYQRIFAALGVEL